MSESLVYITCKTSAEADSIGEVLVGRRLAACVNIIDGMRSMYWWDNKVERGQEFVLIAKTRTSLVDELTEAVKAMHGYEVPCVVVMPITGGNSDFLSWIREETKEP
ncbi:MAG: divalent-cation tolerance protein CutA [Pseudodesulfovibrio sp.]|nr:divalent-cation tolerance protein CutA [Pseudodesulfovibrio sp.]